MRVFFVFFFSFFLIHASTLAQNKATIEQLQQAYQSASTDTAKILRLIDIAFQYYSSKPDTTIQLAQAAFQRANDIGFVKGMAWASNRTGVGYYLKGEYSTALEYYQQALLLFQKINEKKGMAATLNGIGIIYRNQGNESKALEVLQQVVKIQEEINDKKGLATVLTNIGLTYQYQGEDVFALQYYRRGLDLYSALGDKRGIANTLQDISRIYKNNKEYDKALEGYQKGLQMYEEIGDKQGIAISLNYMAEIAQIQQDYDKAIELYEQSRKVSEEMHYKLGTLEALNGLALAYREQGQIEKSIDYARNALQLAEELKNAKEAIAATRNLYLNYKQKKQYEEALAYLEIFKQVEDSLFNIEKATALSKLENKSIIEKKDLQIKQQVQEKKLQQYWNYAITVGFFIALLAVFFVWKLHKKEKEAKDQLANQKEEIERNLEMIHLQRNDLHLKNNAILASINYARRIQVALLPELQSLRKEVQEILLCYLPKDIVSGDFYWLSKIDDKELLLAVADCTGHGVPGAFMTVIGHNLLDQIINKDKIFSPAQILKELDTRLLHTLMPSTESEMVYDGMNIALIRLNLNRQEITFAGAKRPLWIFGQGKELLTEYKGDKFPIGNGMHGEKDFTERKFFINKNDILYLFTDGYADQFGTEGKFTIKKFRNLLQEIHTKDFTAQATILQHTLQHWKGQEKQTDDILIMGLKL